MKNRYYTDIANRLTDKIKSSVGEYNQLIRDLSIEVDRLEKSDEYHRKGYAELYKRIEEAIEKVEEYSRDDFFKKYFGQFILDILRGDKDVSSKEL